ncbi:MAG: DNA/RNA non-specific endonuclease [Actinomycetota bacterium]
MGFFGDPVALRVSSNALKAVGADMERFANALPTTIPTEAWRGPAARAWNEMLPLLASQLRVIAESTNSGAASLSTLANTLDYLNGERDRLIGLGAFDTDISVMSLVLRADAAKRTAAAELAELGRGAPLASYREYRPPQAAVGEGMTPKEKAILAADIAGIADPTPLSDGTAVVLSLSEGDVLGASLSAIGIIPYVGDVAKGLKYGGKALDTVHDADRLTDLAGVASGARVVDGTITAARVLDSKSGYVRLPNASFVDGGYSFVTDEMGRTVAASGPLRLDAASRDGLSRAIGKLGLDGDQGGHLIGARFGGASSAFNLVPQAQRFNQSTFRSMAEEEWAQLLRSGHDVDVSIRPTYDSPETLRPDGFLVEYSVDGVEQPARYFINE